MSPWSHPTTAPPGPLTRDLAPRPGVTLVDGGADVAVYAGHADAVELCLFDAGDTAGTSERRVPLVERAHGWWFGFVPGRRGRAALRLSRPRRLAPRPGSAAQPRQAAARPLRQGPGRQGPLGPGGLRPRRHQGLARRRRADLRPRQPRQHAARCRHRRPLRLGGRRRPQPVAQRERHLRGARAQPDRAPPRRPPAAAWHVCRAGAPRVGGPPHEPRCHGRRAAARPRLHPRTAPRAPWADQPLGLQHPGLLRTARPVRSGERPPGRRRRVQGHGQAAPPGGHRGHPRRRLQPHRRAGPHRRDVVVARPGPARLLPPRRARARHRRHRLRQHHGPAPPRRLPHGARLAALLGAGVPRRRLPLRPGRGARARPR